MLSSLTVPSINADKQILMMMTGTLACKEDCNYSCKHYSLKNVWQLSLSVRLSERSLNSCFSFRPRRDAPLIFVLLYHHVHHPTHTTPTSSKQIHSPRWCRRPGRVLVRRRRCKSRSPKPPHLLICCFLGRRRMSTLSRGDGRCRDGF